jgi:hypothetical protein
LLADDRPQAKILTPAAIISLLRGRVDRRLCFLALLMGEATFK